MLVACWSPKGGSGTTVVSAALAVVLARSNAAGAVLADLGGDLPATLGLPEPPGPGLGDWMAAGPEVPEGALSHLEVEAGPGLRLLPLGTAASPLPGDRGDALAGSLAADARPVVADCGSAQVGAGLALAAGASVSLAVLRPCYLALRRALAAPVSPSGVVVVLEPDRSLAPGDVEEVLGVPVVARVPHDAGVARAVDAGLLARRPPRRLERALRPVVTDLLGFAPPVPSRRAPRRAGLARGAYRPLGARRVAGS